MKKWSVGLLAATFATSVYVLGGFLSYWWWTLTHAMTGKGVSAVWVSNVGTPQSLLVLVGFITTIAMVGTAFVMLLAGGQVSTSGGKAVTLRHRRPSTQTPSKNTGGSTMPYPIRCLRGSSMVWLNQPSVN